MEFSEATTRKFQSFSAEIARPTLSALKTGSIGRDLREIAYADPVRRELPDRAPSALRRPSRCVLGRDPSVGRATLSEYGLRRLICLLKRIWRAHGLQPHRVRQFKLSNDPQ
jgi:hypothetical protein